MAVEKITRTADEVYGSAYSDFELFEQELDRSLNPRGYRLLFDLVSDLELPAGRAGLDVGCRDGFFTIELARRFGLDMTGIDPVPRHRDLAARSLSGLAARKPELAARVRVTHGVAESLDLPDRSVSLVWCRDVLIHVEDLDAAFSEFRRVLRPDGAAVVYQMFATDWLTDQEAELLWPPTGVHASSVDTVRFEVALERSGLRIEHQTLIGSEWREYGEELGEGKTSQQLLYSARLLRNRSHYEEKFGTKAYEAVLANSLWGVYQMIGKLSSRAYVLRAAD